MLVQSRGLLAITTYFFLTLPTGSCGNVFLYSSNPGVTVDPIPTDLDNSYDMDCLNILYVVTPDIPLSGVACSLQSPPTTIAENDAILLGLDIIANSE